MVGDGGSAILDRLDCELPLDGITVIVGPSGAGKTTLLRLCNRLEVPTRGRLLLDGQDVAEIAPLALRRHVGMVFQRPTLFPGSVRDNLHVARADAPDAALSEILGRVGLDPAVLDRAADDLSGGEGQRVCVARALLTEPSVLLMDEPTSSLDPDHRATIEQLARGLARDGLAVVWVTHDLRQAVRLGDRVMVVIGGRLAGADEAAAYLASDESDELQLDDRLED